MCRLKEKSHHQNLGRFAPTKEKKPKANTSPRASQCIFKPKGTSKSVTTPVVPKPTDTVSQENVPDTGPKTDVILDRAPGLYLPKLKHCIENSKYIICQARVVKKSTPIVEYPMIDDIEAHLNMISQLDELDQKSHKHILADFINVVNKIENLHANLTQRAKSLEIRRSRGEDKWSEVDRAFMDYIEVVQHENTFMIEVVKKEDLLCTDQVIRCEVEAIDAQIAIFYHSSSTN